MYSDQLLIFDVCSEYGHFRKFNTTTSPLTYSIPTRPAIVGLLGAILGIERETFADQYAAGVIPVSELFSKNQAGISVQILNPIKKVNIAFNLLDTEKTASSFFNIKQRTQIEFELLKNPSFRIFVRHKDEVIFKDLTQRIQENSTYFTPYLGLSQFTAVIHFKALVKTNSFIKTDFLPVVTAVNLSNTNPESPILFNRSTEFKYTSDTMPVEMQRDRVVIEYAEVIVETNGKPILIKSDKIYQTEEFGNILFL